MKFSVFLSVKTHKKVENYVIWYHISMEYFKLGNVKIVWCFNRFVTIFDMDKKLQNIINHGTYNFMVSFFKSK